MLTPTQEDYIEVIFRLEETRQTRPVRVTDIASELGTRLPTVTRTIRRLAHLRLVVHPARGAVHLTETGRRMAREILHRHVDLVKFFTDILGLPRPHAEADACQMEHGMSSLTAQRLHEFLDFVETQSIKRRSLFDDFKAGASGGKQDFEFLPEGRTNGWRT